MAKLWGCLGFLHFEHDIHAESAVHSELETCNISRRLRSPTCRLAEGRQDGSLTHVSHEFIDVLRNSLEAFRKGRGIESGLAWPQSMDVRYELFVYWCWSSCDSATHVSSVRATFPAHCAYTSCSHRLHVEFIIDIVFIYHDSLCDATAGAHISSFSTCDVAVIVRE